MPSGGGWEVQRVAMFIAVLLILAGATFAAQGLGILRSRSVMTDDLRWTAIGAAMVALGVGLAWWSRRRAGRLA
jgi:hypothetical protein